MGNIGKLRIYYQNTLKRTQHLNLNLKARREDGLTFAENSIIKSKYFSKKTKKVCLADDSGLEIDILDKSPGIYSARWAGKKGNFKKAIARVYRELSKKDKNWRDKKG
jgi:XTP/dITP diphosphohydrolase